MGKFIMKKLSDIALNDLEEKLRNISDIFYKHEYFVLSSSIDNIRDVLNKINYEDLKNER